LKNDLFDSFCTKKKVNSMLKLKTQMNLAGKGYKEAALRRKDIFSSSNGVYHLHSDKE
jgi:hypothetical protein